MLDGYWISPLGETYDVPITHIDFVVKNPDLFGYTREELQHIADEHGEYITAEGKARNEVMTELLKKGWIRVRYDKQREWILQIWTLSKNVKDNLFSWVYSMVDGVIKGAKKVYQHTQIFLMELGANNNSVIATFGDIPSGRLFEILAKARDEGRFIIDKDVDLNEVYKPRNCMTKTSVTNVGKALNQLGILFV